MDTQKNYQAETLLKVADRYQWEGLNVYEAVELAAQELDLKVISSDNSCRVYEIEDNVLTNCWIG